MLPERQRGTRKCVEALFRLIEEGPKGGHWKKYVVINDEGKVILSFPVLESISCSDELELKLALSQLANQFVKMIVGVIKSILI
jgi:hypothetical protein